MAAAQAAAILAIVVTGLEQAMQVDQVAVVAVIGVQLQSMVTQVVLALQDKDLLEQTVLNQPFI
jgi:hypothetical protein